MRSSIVVSLVSFVALIACSSPPANHNETPTPAPTTTTDAGTTAAAPTQESCIAACQKQHATGATLSSAVDTCWVANCDTPCETGTPTGQDFPPNVQGDAGAKDCTQPVLTPTETCSTCTVQHCCSQWNALFASVDGQALRDCVSPCWTLPHAAQ